MGKWRVNREKSQGAICRKVTQQMKNGQKINRLKNQVLDYLERAENEIRQIEPRLSLGKQRDWGQIRNKLKNDTFNLVLAGEFQRGKSTLFDYLCGGRELSTLGELEGGIPTSACLVSASAISESEREYAEIRWKSVSELVAPLVDVLGIAENKLSDMLIANSLVPVAWKAWSSRRDFGEQRIKKQALLQYALIIGSFYRDLRGRNAEARCSIGQATTMGARPQNWEKRWNSIHSASDIRRQFRVQDILFAFITSIELYLHAPLLRQLNCVVTDCPGLAASGWDDGTAEQCMQNADVILYLLPYDKGLGNEEVKNIGKYGCNKLLFGVNLKRAEDEWNRIEKEQIVPKLKTLGFRELSIYRFHAGLALRAKEYQDEMQGGLDEASARAIENNMRWFPKQKTRLTYLEHQINKYLRVLSDDEESIELYRNGYRSLEQRSGVPSLVKLASTYVSDNKMHRLWVEEGLDVMLHWLKSNIQSLQEKTPKVQTREYNRVTPVKPQNQGKTLQGEAVKKQIKRKIDREIKFYLPQIVEVSKDRGDRILRGYRKKWIDLVVESREILKFLGLNGSPIMWDPCPPLIIGMSKEISWKRRNYFSANVINLLGEILGKIERELKDSLSCQIEFLRLKDCLKQLAEEALSETRCEILPKNPIFLNPPITINTDVHELSSLVSNNFRYFIDEATKFRVYTDSSWAEQVVDQYWSVIRWTVHQAIEKALYPPQGGLRVVLEVSEQMKQALDRCTKQSAGVYHDRLKQENIVRQKSNPETETLTQGIKKLQNLYNEGELLKLEFETVFRDPSWIRQI